MQRHGDNHLALHNQIPSRPRQHTPVDRRALRAVLIFEPCHHLPCGIIILKNRPRSVIRRGFMQALPAQGFHAQIEPKREPAAQT